MPCHHKFLDYLNLSALDFEPTTLIVGTFNPGWPIGNNAEWFYGRTGSNYFWDVLPRIYNTPSMVENNHIDWKNFCRNNRIAITDLISCIEDADEENIEHQKWLMNYSDRNIAEKFHQHNYVDIIQLLTNHPTITNVYLTRLGVTGHFWGNLYMPIQAYCNQNEIRLTKLLTPSGNARFQHTDNQIRLPDFILSRWLNSWHPL